MPEELNQALKNTSSTNPNRFPASGWEAPSSRGPAESLAGCNRIIIIGRTGSGKTTLGRQLANYLGVPHIELDSLLFGPDFTTVSLDVLRERTKAAIAGERWVTDGNKSSVRDLVWPRADTIVWLDYSILVSLWRLGRRAIWRSSLLQEQARESGTQRGLGAKYLAGARGVLKALSNHRGQRKEYPRLFALPENQHMLVVRLRSPRAAQKWLERVTNHQKTP